MGPLKISILHALIQVIEEECIQANAGKMGDIFITELMKLREEFEVVGDVRGKGLMLGEWSLSRTR